MRSLKPDPRLQTKVNVQLRWISTFSKSSWIKATASGLSYELDVNGEKKLMETGVLVIKMDIAHFTLVNLEILSLREVTLIILWHRYLEIDRRWESVPKKVLWLLTSFRWYV